MNAPSERTRWMLASAIVHACVLTALSALPLPPPEGPRFHRLDATEFSLEPEPTPPAPEAPPAPPPPPEADVARPAARPPPSVAPARTATPPPRAASIPTPTPTPTPTPSPSTPPPVLRATDLLRSGSTAMDFPIAPATRPEPARTNVFVGSEGSANDRALAASQGYVRDALAASTAREAPGVRGYLWNVRRRVSEAWRPGVVRVPNLAETLFSGFLSPERAMRVFGARMIRRQQLALEPPPARLGGAVDAIEAIGGVAGIGPTGRQNIPTNASDESWRRNTRTTRAEVEVEQDAQGRVLEVRLLHPSGIAGFDRAALDAVRVGIDEQDPIALPGGRRSRWSFTVVATRRLLAPSIGGSFDESRGWFRVEVPGQVSLRSRVQMESSAPLESPASASP